MVGGNPNFVRNHPVATKRALRAILKAADLCVSDPARVARRLVDGGFTPRYEYALQALREIPYDKWREWDPEDTIRFYALRLRDNWVTDPKVKPIEQFVQGKVDAFLGFPPEPQDLRARQMGNVINRELCRSLESSVAGWLLFRQVPRRPSLPSESRNLRHQPATAFSEKVVSASVSLKTPLTPSARV
jgi:hypothetical protein